MKITPADMKLLSNLMGRVFDTEVMVFSKCLEDPSDRKLFVRFTIRNSIRHLSIDKDNLLDLQEVFDAIKKEYAEQYPQDFL